MPDRFPPVLRMWARRLGRLSPADWSRLLWSLGVTAAMWTALRLVSVRRVLAWTDVSTSAQTSIPDGQQSRILWAVAAVNRRLFPSRPCLTQALTARYLLARRGIPSTFRIGVTRGEDQSLQAHAWLEQDGKVIIGGQESPDAYHLLRGAESLDPPEVDQIDRVPPEPVQPRDGSFSNA